MDIEHLKNKFPKIYEDIQNSPTIEIDQIKKNTEKTCPTNKNTQQKQTETKTETKIPTIKDHLTRCNTDKQAIEIIDYFNKQGEITKEKTKQLKKQLKTKGLRSFGEKRKKGEIEKNGL
ncbi:hypothetical protein AMET1_0270 [Methanonatronarchaeum thermophilum]|uniref:DUF2095 domain-containing protein n=1 Tax=Methanonatronarchaeum thermophilum TaxID=1927129 RepID=A0A1Y3GEL4_9EURY|nr:DUF2095 family protein [Methanonatronarchaeum thermophilum]OUJ18624.1 hypothetical protein AMET1_0270 [Methanonatronarchaeum thermophilum]